MRLLTLITIGLFAGTLVAAPVPKEKPKDEEAILGTWRVDKFDAGVDGLPSPPGVDKMRLTFGKDGKLSATGADGTASEGKYSLDATGAPKGLTLTTKNEGEQLGVYELDGDTLKLAVPGIAAKTRPTEVKADGKGVVLLTLKRVKEDKKGKDEEAILGAWSVTKFDNGTGTFPTDATLARMRCTFTKDGKRLTVGGDGEERSDEFKLDPTAKPKVIDITVKGVMYLGVYELDGDTLTICTGQGKERPTELKAEKDKFSLTVFKRVKDEKSKEDK